MQNHQEIDLVDVQINKHTEILKLLQRKRELLLEKMPKKRSRYFANDNEVPKLLHKNKVYINNENDKPKPLYFIDDEGFIPN